MAPAPVSPVETQSTSFAAAAPNVDVSTPALAELVTEDGFRSLKGYTAEWDNRVGVSSLRNLKRSTSALRLYHSAERCESSPCPVGAPALRLYLNAPLGTDPSSFRVAAESAYATHNVGLYVRSHGQSASALDPTQSIPPAGILLEPHGAHHALRIDAQNSAAPALRVEVPSDGRGVLLLGNARPSTYCDAVRGGDCKALQGSAVLLSAKNGIVDLSNTQVRREFSKDDGQLFSARKPSPTGEVRWLRWTHATPDGLMSCSCVFIAGSALQNDSKVRVTPAQPGELTRPHSYSVRAIWSVGNAPSSCRGTQIARPDSGKPAYAIGAPPPSLVEQSSGFEACLHLSPGEEPPSSWDPIRAPSFLYELIQAS